ncbi:MAG: hypothetical protein D6741_02835 [Planctomycetota bacterium]|nr:MAG: hypothetical protein D6741_02835 [Planctomycetota bacterium]
MSRPDESNADIGTAIAGMFIFAAIVELLRTIGTLLAIAFLAFLGYMVYIGVLYAYKGVCMLVEYATRKRRLARNAAWLRERLMQDVLKGRLIIDSNIWMNEKYDAFFVVLEQVLVDTGRKIELYGPQFDEICNIKHRTNFNSAKGRRSRLALSRIEHFQKRRILSIRPIRIDRNRFAYADPLILRLLVCAPKNNMPTCLITDDRELRIRAREICRRARSAEPTLFEVHDLLPHCRLFVEALSEGVVPQ